MISTPSAASQDPVEIFSACPPSSGTSRDYARDSSDQAWTVALAHQFAMKVSGSAWHRQLSAMGDAEERSRYWLVPFQNYRTFCPHLVGSYAEVAEELSGYLAAGYRTFILDVPASPEELEHIHVAFTLAREATPCLG